MRNKYTKEWQFPVGEIFMGQSLMRAKQNLFTDISGGSWRVKYYGNLPQVHTMRNFTVAESEDKEIAHLKGVRTYFFTAHHWRGLPELVIREEMKDKLHYDDFAWIPKRKMNEFFTRDYYEIFANACLTR